MPTMMEEVMSEQKKRTDLSTDVAKRESYKGLSLTARLVLRLMTDNRVNVLLKLLPLGTLVYLLMPDPVPFIVDDALIIGLGTYVFIELCPPEVVEEHKAKLSGKVPSQTGDGEQVVDSEFSNE
jgi:uncharacterized membrane protein YkvA (DUF1232 family)